MNRIQSFFIFVIIFFTFIPQLLACGALDGRGLHCTVSKNDNDDINGYSIGHESFFYFQGKEVLEPYFRADETPIMIGNNNLGVYYLDSKIMKWGEETYFLNRANLELRKVDAGNVYFNCELISNPLRKIMKYFQPKIDEVKSSMARMNK